MSDSEHPKDLRRESGAVQQGSQDSLEGAPVQQVIQGFAALISRSDPDYNPMFEKFEPQHITQFLGNLHEADTEERQLRRSDRWFRVLYALLGVAVFFVLLERLLPEREDLLIEILKVVGAFAAGGFGGYGLRAYQERRKR